MKTFTVVTADSPKLVFETEATTFGELKEELTNKGISLEGKKIIEGLTKIDMTKAEDSYVLPHDVTFKGNITNDLVFMVNSDKKINSGLSRKEIFNKIKEYGLSEKVYDIFDKNYTNVSNDSLMEIIEDYEAKISVVSGVKTPIYDAKNHCVVGKNTILCEALINSFIHTILEYDAEDLLVKALVDNNILESLTESKNSYSDEDIEEMFRGL